MIAKIPVHLHGSLQIGRQLHFRAKVQEFKIHINLLWRHLRLGTWDLENMIDSQLLMMSFLRYWSFAKVNFWLATMLIHFYRKFSDQSWQFLWPIWFVIQNSRNSIKTNIVSWVVNNMHWPLPMIHFVYLNLKEDSWNDFFLFEKWLM